MYQRFFRLLLLITVGLALALAVWLALPQPKASAQCGRGASSCKTCHEIQGKLRVNTKGEWHTQHSFGDFCVFCHGGDTKAKDKAQAHKGMAGPLDDVNAACATCHSEDCTSRADRYAKILGVTVGIGGGTSAPRGPTPLLPFVPRVAGVGDSPSPFDMQAPSPFASSSTAPVNQEPDSPGVNWGNVALAAIALALLLGGGGFVLWNERQLMIGWDKAINTRPELQQLMPLLAEADAQTVKIIAKTLAERDK